MVVFQELIQDLQARGWTQAALAEEVGCSQQNIARMLAVPGAEPKYSVGAALVQLEKRRRKPR